MNDSLVRVIEQQQTEIDRLSSLITAYQRQIAAYEKRESDLFAMFDAFYEIELPKFDDIEKRNKYISARQEIKIYMMNKGWCFACGSFNCECDDEV